MHADLSLGDEKMVSAPLALRPSRSFGAKAGKSEQIGIKTQINYLNIPAIKP